VSDECPTDRAAAPARDTTIEPQAKRSGSAFRPNTNHSVNVSADNPEPLTVGYRLDAEEYLVDMYL